MSGTAQVFISYSQLDADRAGKLQKALERRKLKVWRDSRDIIPGQHLSTTLQDSLRNSRGVVVLFTEHSVGSAWVLYEYAFALSAGVPVVEVWRCNMASRTCPRQSANS